MNISYDPRAMAQKQSALTVSAQYGATTVTRTLQVSQGEYRLWGAGEPRLWVYVYLSVFLLTAILGMIVTA